MAFFEDPSFLVHYVLLDHAVARDPHDVVRLDSDLALKT